MSWLPLRLARREVRRRPGRTALVALLVAVPVAAMVIAVTLIRTEAETPEEDWRQENGTADAVSSFPPPTLPEGSRAIVVQETLPRVKTVDGRRATVDVTNFPLDDPLTEGIYELVAGRAVRADGEAVISPALADAFGVEVGDELRLERPALTLRIVGEAERTTCLSCHALHLQVELADPQTTTLVDLPADLSRDELTDLQRASGGLLTIRELRLLEDHYEEVDSARAIQWTLVLGGVVLTVVGIVISAAFAIGARRQLVTVGQLSASGAPPSAVRAALMLQGTIAGVIGTIVGGLLAAGVLVLGEGRLERIIDQRIHGYELDPLGLVAVGLIGILAATMAALLPARTAARIPTLAALAGRRPLSPVSHRQLAWGAAGVAGGMALLFLAVLGSQGGASGVWVFVATAGGVAELLGACAIAPAVVARLEPLSGRLRGGLRLGARSLARNRARTGAVVSAVAAASALAVIAGAILLAEESQRRERDEIPDDLAVLNVYEYGEGVADPSDAFTPTLRDDLRGLLPGAQELSVVTALAAEPAQAAPGSSYWEVLPASDDERWDGDSSQTAVVVDEALLGALRATREVRDALTEHGLVALSHGGEDGFAGEALLVLPDLRRVPGIAVVHPYVLTDGTSVLITPEKVTELGLTTAETMAVFHTPEPLTAAQRDGLEDVKWDLDFASGLPETFVAVHWDRGSERLTLLQLEVLLTVVALAFALSVVGVSLALAAAESKDERDVLTIAGAPPAALARSAGARGWLLTFIGTVMAVPVGFLPVVVVSQATGQNSNGIDQYPVIFPTRTVLLLVVVVPLAVSLASWVASATGQRLRPVRVSTATFE